MNWTTLLPIIVSSVSTVKQIIDIATSNADIVAKIKSGVPALANLLASLGAELFPGVKKELQIAAGAMAAFDPDITKWVQGALNVVLEPTPGLTVDGIYGPKTRAAVELLQQKNDLTVDGWAGNITQALIAGLLSKRPQIAA